MPGFSKDCGHRVVSQTWRVHPTTLFNRSGYFLCQISCLATKWKKAVSALDLSQGRVPWRVDLERSICQFNSLVVAKKKKEKKSLEIEIYSRKVCFRSPMHNTLQEATFLPLDVLSKSDMCLERLCSVKERYQWTVFSSAFCPVFLGDFR